MHMGEGSRGCNRAPLLIFRSRKPWQGHESWKDTEGR
jgi:hypothetical protein